MGGDRAVCGMNITKETFENLDSKGRDSIIFDCLMTITKDVNDIKQKEKIDQKKIMGTASVLGLIGGIIGSFLKTILP